MNAAEPIRIHVGQQREGCTYALHPRSRARIEAAHPTAQIASQIFVGFENEGSLVERQGLVWDKVAALLTGLNAEQLQALGGVEIYDPATDTHLPVTALAS